MSRALELRASLIASCEQLASHIEATYLGPEKAAEKLAADPDIFHIIDELDEVKGARTSRKFRKRLEDFFRAVNGVD